MLLLMVSGEASSTQAGTALGEQGQWKKHTGAPSQLLLQDSSLGLLLRFKLSFPLGKWVSRSTSGLIPSNYMTWATNGQADLAFRWPQPNWEEGLGHAKDRHKPEVSRLPWGL